jgi:putative chitinase
VHVVKSGETLTGIAARYGVTIAALQEANGIKDPNLINAGQKLVIPAP